MIPCLGRLLRTRWFRVLVSASLIAALIYIMDPREALTAIRSATPGLVALSIAGALCNRILVPLKWNMLLRARGNHLTGGASISIYFISSFLGFFLPATVGADAVRTYLASAERVDVKETLASIIVERVLGLICLILFMIFSVALLVRLVGEGQFDSTAAIHIGLVALVLSAGLFLASFTRPVLDLARGVIARFGRAPRLQKTAATLEELLYAYAGYRNHKVTMLLFFGLTVVEISLVVLRCYLAGLALHLGIGLSYFFAFIPIVLFFARLPISFDGFGINEGLYVYFLALAGIAPAEAFTLGLLNHLLAMVAMLPGGLLYALYRPSVRAIGRVKRDDDPTVA